MFWVEGLAHVCLQTCDPLLQDCNTGQASLPECGGGAQDFVCAAEYSFSEGQEFDPCEFSNACDPGLVCWTPTEAVECDQGAIGRCLSFCDVTNPQCVGMGAECVSFYGEIGGQAPPAFANLGNLRDPRLTWRSTGPGGRIAAAGARQSGVCLRRRVAQPTRPNPSSAPPGSSVAQPHRSSSGNGSR